MKRTILVLSALAIGVGIYTTSQLTAQGPVAVAATKVGTVNIGQVFQQYKKAEFFKYEMEQSLKPIRDEVEKLNKLIRDWQKALAPGNKLNDQQKDQGARTIVDAKRRLEDLDREARKKIGKKNEEQIVQLYREVATTIDRYAKSQGFHVVFGYGDLPNSDPFSFVNIARKMQAMDGGGIVNIYSASGLDISNGVIASLNQAYINSGGPTVPAGAGGVNGTPTSNTQQ